MIKPKTYKELKVLHKIDEQMNLPLRFHEKIYVQIILVASVNTFV